MSDFGKFCDLCENADDFKCGCDGDADTAKMEVKHKGKPYAILVCTDCEDEATPKNIRQKIQNRLDKYTKLVEDAKELGVELDLEMLLTKKDGLIVATPAEPVLAAPASNSTIQQPMPTQPAERLLDDQGNRIRSQSIKSKEVQIIEANLHGSGRPIALPKKEIGNTGTTYYTINRTSDADLQDRFRKQAARSQMNPNDPSMYKPCTACGGEGSSTIINKGQKEMKICQQCEGVGMCP